jgi:hypothetical protein
VTCDDDNEIGFTAQLSVNRTAGVTYCIQIAKYDGTTTGSHDASKRGQGLPEVCTAVFHVKNQTFADVPPTHPYFQYVEALYAAGPTGGCSSIPLNFCPSASMSRAQSAVFMLRGNFGSSYVPVTPTHCFADNWVNSSWGEGWAESMYLEGLPAGCASSPWKFCPDDVLTNAQLAVFGLRLKYGNAYAPPAATGTVFADLTDLAFWGIAWAEKAYADGLIPACGTDAGGGQAKFLSRSVGQSRVWCVCDRQSQESDPVVLNSETIDRLVARQQAGLVFCSQVKFHIVDVK